MNTRFPVFSAHRTLFAGGPGPAAPSKETSKPGFLTPSTPSTIKTDKDTVEIVQGAREKLQALLDAGTIDSTAFKTISKGLEQSEETSDDYKSKARTLYSKLFEADDDLKELRRTANQEIGSLMQENRSLGNQVDELEQQVAKQAGDQPNERRPAARKEHSLLRHTLQKPKSNLRNSLTFTEEVTAPDTNKS